MKRVFIAIKVETGGLVYQLITSLKSELRTEIIKWTDPENLHITILFLGNTDEEKVDIISTGLKEVCNGFGQFAMVIKGIGIFKSLNQPRVLWAGIEPSGKLELLNINIVTKLRSLGFSIGDYYFKPHLTLGRIKSIVQKNALKMQVDKYCTTEFQNLTVENIILYESILLASGPVYKPIDKFTLK
jgi:2'-5' RNA ligase